MLTRYWELKKTKAQRVCAYCWRKITHRFVGRWDKIFGPYWEQVREWEAQGKVVAIFNPHKKDYYLVCEACKCGLRQRK